MATKNNPVPKLHLQLFSIHGLIRGEDMELGRDADTGGQVKYVVSLARALSKHPDVKQVDLFTRYIDDKKVSPDYKKEIEPIGDKARIVRIPCGGKRYMRKELLWPHLDEYVDNVISFNKKEGIKPSLFHGHYADAGYITRQLSKLMGIPYVFTGHSLGRSKMFSLDKEGMSLEQMNKKFNIERRIMAEEKVMQTANLIVTSTGHEIKKQYGKYENADKPKYVVVPPGINIERFYPFYNDHDEAFHKPEVAKQARYKLSTELGRFFKDPQKPLILAICRPDSKKNIQGLVKAFAISRTLQSIANLAIFAGIRKDIDNMDENERQVLTDLLFMMDKHDLYGKMAIPKKHDPNNEVPELFRMAADSRGVFVNSAFNEPFGLTLIEAASSGCPIVGPDDGGPNDIVKNCKNGLLADTTSPRSIADAIKKILLDPDKWTKYSNNGINGVREYYSWDAHADTFIKKVTTLLNKELKEGTKKQVAVAPAKRLANIKKFFITDIDNTLVGDDKSMNTLFKELEKHKDDISFGVATGRSIELVQEIITEKKIPTPDIVICSVGTEIYYGGATDELSRDDGWAGHISYLWKPQAIKSALSGLSYLKMQKADGEREFKLSYNMKPNDDHLAEIHKILTDLKLRYQLIYSHGEFLDIIPQRASKGKAIDYICKKWHVRPTNTLVSGDSGNDTEMLKGKRQGIVVGNYSPELEELRNSTNVYFAKGEYAAGILEGMAKFNFLK